MMMLTSLFSGGMLNVTHSFTYPNFETVLNSSKVSHDRC